MVCWAMAAGFVWPGEGACHSWGGWGQASLSLVPGLGTISSHLLFLAASSSPGSWKLVRSARRKKGSTWAKPCWRMALSTMVSGRRCGTVGCMSGKLPFPQKSAPTRPSCWLRPSHTDPGPWLLRDPSLGQQNQYSCGRQHGRAPRQASGQGAESAISLFRKSEPSV